MIPKDVLTKVMHINLMENTNPFGQGLVVDLPCCDLVNTAGDSFLSDSEVIDMVYALIITGLEESNVILNDDPAILPLAILHLTDKQARGCHLRGLYYIGEGGSIHHRYRSHAIGFVNRVIGSPPQPHYYFDIVNACSDDKSLTRLLTGAADDASIRGCDSKMTEKVEGLDDDGAYLPEICSSCTCLDRSDY